MFVEPFALRRARCGAIIGKPEHIVAPRPIFIFAEHVEPVGVGVTIGKTELEAVLIAVGQIGLIAVAQIVIAREHRPVAADLARDVAVDSQLS